MRVALVLMIAASALAAPALAQPSAPLPQPIGQTGVAAPPQAPDKARQEASAPARNAEADAALAMTIRLRQEAEQRIARIACAAGDTAKCAIVEAAKDAPK